MFLRGSFPRGNCLGNKSSERQFSSGAFFRWILSGGNYVWGNFPGAIIQDPGDNYPGGNFPCGQFPGGQLSGEQSSRGNCPGGNYPGDNFPWGQLSGQ